MKVSRLPASAQEECGVWLDTAELRRKRKAVQLPRRISRLLNPLAPSAGYCIPAAVSFTQTTLQFPVTKQSSIMNFLSPRCHENKGAEPAAVIDPPSSAPQRKRKRFDEIEEPSNQSALGAVLGSRALPLADLGGGATEGSRRVGICEGEEEPVRKRPWNNTETQGPHTLPHCTQGPYTEETQGPHSQSHCTDETQGPHSQSHCTDETQGPHMLSHCTAETQGRHTLSYCTQGPYTEEAQGPHSQSHCTEKTQGPYTLSHCTAETQGRHMLSHCTAETQGPQTLSRCTAETQGPQTLSRCTEEKENDHRRPRLPPSSSLSPRSTSWRSESSWLSPQKRPLRDLRETQVQSLELLFTQDSEGRRVIAHPAAAYRSPLKDRTNSSAGAERPWAVPSRQLMRGESDSVLELCSDLRFTQDSEGNRVMKH